MVLLNLYGKIEPIIISKKLGIGICNPAPDWVDGFQDDIQEEIIIHNHQLSSLPQSSMDVWVAKEYDLKSVVQKLGWQEDGKCDTQIIAEHLIEIQVSNFENSLLQKKNENLDNPTCEPQYTRKFIDFCYKVQSSNSAKKYVPNSIPFSIYNSDDFDAKPQILSHLQGRLHPHPAFKISVSDYTQRGIDALIKIGELIDNFLITDKDFWLFDYIINALFFDEAQNAYHIFKTMSLIEMFIINPKGNGKTLGEMELKLPQFLSDRIPPKDRAIFSQIMRKLRNKIGHGDFEAVQQLLEQYRQVFMQNFWFDEIEYSIENWTYGDICLRLDEALNEILWLMLSDKNRLLALQLS